MISSRVIQGASELLAAGKRAEAAAALRKHLERVPGDLEAALLLSRVHTAQGESEKSAECLKRAAAIHTKDARLHYALGEALLAMGRHAEAMAAFETSVRFAPQEPAPYQGIAKCLLAKGDAAGAVAICAKAVAAAPEHPDAHFAMTDTLARLGRFREAMQSARAGLAYAPDDPLLLEAAIYAMNVSDGVPPEELAELHRRLGRAIGVNPRSVESFPNRRDPERPLKVGLLSCDFRTHSCAFFLEGLLRELDRSRLMPILYSTTAQHDDVTERFKALAAFHDLTPMTAPQVMRQIEGDAPDIMLDLSGWVSRAQMRLMAGRVAPLQGTYLGYPNTTGVPAIDLRIVDAVTDPAGAEAYATERLVRLPRCFLAFTARESWPEAGTAPGGAEGPITFGSFNNIMKLSETTLRMWKRILDAVPGSRLLLKSPRLPEALLAHNREMLAAAGIPVERLTLHPYVDDLNAHVALYHRVDIALDPYPYHGTTTTCEALWMGVPVVSLRGDTHRSRVGASLLTAVGVPELIAGSEDEYVEIAAGLARDRSRLAEYHAGLRGKMAASALCDSKGLARAMEAALREEWRRLCASR